jgi:hypothetical protein
MKNILTVLAIITLSCSQAFAQSSIQQSHIEANVPSASEFKSLLERDLLAYFRSSGVPSATAVQFKLLRDGPTQSGVAYPKYYAWVRAVAGSQTLKEGAVRIAAIQRTRFEVTHFIPSQEIKSNPSKVGSTFPAPLVPEVLSLAGATK